MDIFICSDIHGRLEEYQEVLKRVGDNQLYVLGDCIDRHPNGADILLDIMHQDNVTLLLGNHEWMMYQTLFVPSGYVQSIWCSMNNGGAVTLHAIQDAIKNKAVTMNELEAFLLSCPLYIDFGSIYLCHGLPHFTLFTTNLDSEVASFEQPHILTLKDAIENGQEEVVDKMVWNSVFRHGYYIPAIEETRQIETTVYSGHVIDEYAISTEQTEDGLPLLKTDDEKVTCIDIDGGCAFPFDLEYNGHLNLLNITRGAYERIESK